jgi:hypothetical protein
VVGTDDQVYVHKFDANGNPVGSYAVVENKVLTISLGVNPRLVVIGTDNQVYFHRFDDNGNPVGDYVLIPNHVKAISVGQYGNQLNLLFVIGTDNQVYVNRFDSNGAPIGGYIPIPNMVKSIKAGTERSGLFVVGTDDQVYMHQFDDNGQPVGNYVLIGDGKVIAIGDEIPLQTTLANPIIQWMPAEIGFPTAPVDVGIVKRSLTISNAGDAILAILPTLGPETLGHGAIFDLVNQSGNSILGTRTSIPSHGNSVFEVTFDYTSALGAHRLNLQVQTNDPANQNIQIPLSATVLPSRN